MSWHDDGFSWHTHEVVPNWSLRVWLPGEPGTGLWPWTAVRHGTFAFYRGEAESLVKAQEAAEKATKEHEKWVISRT